MSSRTGRPAVCRLRCSTNRHPGRHGGEQDDLVGNFVRLISQAARPVQERMVWHFLMADDELACGSTTGWGISPDDVRHLEPLQTQTLFEAELARLSNLGKNGPRDVTGPIMTHSVPNEHVAVSR